MATLALSLQTLGGFIEVGDQLRSGKAPEDFVTVLELADRPTYVKLLVETFDGSTDILRVPRTAVVLLAPGAPEDAVEGEEVVD